MHGRRANRANEEEQARVQKVKELIPLVNNLIKKKKTNSYDKEYIDRTSLILMKCPYLQTLWNYRREYFEYIKPEYLKGKKEIEDEKCDMTKTSEELKKILKDENNMVEDILNTFNKCNELWFHKLWIIKYGLKDNLIDMKDLLNELEYCKRSFYKDDRNYHCWNYRSYIISCIHIVHTKLNNMNKENNEKEKKINETIQSNQSNGCFNFDVYETNYKLSKMLIENNFSNFSAWFLKYSLKKSIIDTNNELNLIKNAIFTDPFDQSLWEFYKWFLFQNGNDKEEILFILLNNNTIYLFFQNLINLNITKCICYDNNNKEIKGSWDKHIIKINNSNNINDSNNKESFVFSFTLDKNDLLLGNIPYIKFVLYYYKYNIYVPHQIHYEQNILKDIYRLYNNSSKENNKYEHSIIYQIDITKISKCHLFNILLDINQYNRKGMYQFSNNIDDNNDQNKIYYNFYKYINSSNILLNISTNMDLHLLNLELEQINELLLLENDCKFALYTKFEILKRIEHFEEALKVLDYLKQVDFLRLEYYKDQETEILIKKRIHDYYETSEKGNNNEMLDLTHMNIKSIIYPLMIEAFFITKIDLSNNSISEGYSGKGTLNFLYNLRELCLNNNKLKNFIFLMKNLYNLKLLEKLDVSNNHLVDMEQDLDQYEFVILPSLKYINISNTNIALLLNEKYKHKNILNTYNIIRHNNTVVLSKL
ncbi:protein prenyltransferase alpha subunit, putative [Plasmodium reichenowi]|uniref:Geranylgeranyl transferase type-2 subunit alpha n=1 Tax=Plasmodium reichenowi TaxID=5854 RepID=A0A2P9DPP2_PLARE|nr:protein prenyltransferase alpha subunit, putative [Plasmodium reichenowi]